jgi:hypothetical protein
MCAFSLLLSTPATAQFVTIARKVKSMHTPKTDVATVLIEAKTYRVYQAVIDTLTAHKKFKILSKDNSLRKVEFSNGIYTVNMQIDSLANGFSQITVVSDHTDNAQQPQANIAVNAVIAICEKLGVKCTSGN